MKLFGFPIAYVVIAVGVLGFVVWSFAAYYDKDAFFEDETLKCKRTYDFSNVQFTPEARADWNACYMPEPQFELRRGPRYNYNNYKCVAIPEYSCEACAGALALKYNNSNYCDLMKPCGWPNTWISICKNATLGIPFTHYIYIVKEDLTEVHKRANAIYPQLKEREKEFEKLYLEMNRSTLPLGDNKFFTRGLFD